MKRIDPWTTLLPFGAIAVLCAVFIAAPDRSQAVLNAIHTFLGTSFGWYYLVIGLGVFLISLAVAFSPLGTIRLGKPEERPQYGFWSWGAMIFTCGLAADILFYSLCEWIYYAQEPYILEKGALKEWAPAYSLFHWGPIPWSFYAVLAACFGFMLHVRGVGKQKYSEACRPILGAYTDRAPGKLIDLLAVFALIAGTATTFSVATPLLSAALSALTGFPESKYLTIGILLCVCLIYTLAVVRGIRGVSWLANACMILFGALLAYVLLFGGQVGFILKTGVASVGRLIAQFFPFAVHNGTDFARNWTIFYWAYWMVWCVASPFFMGSVSRGRTVRQVILGAYGFGMSSTLIAFLVFGNYGLGLQISGRFDALGFYAAAGNIYETVLSMLRMLPVHGIALALLVLSMAAFYATSFDSITIVASAYSYREQPDGAEASGRMKLFWALLLILLPIALIFSESGMTNLQTVSIIAAFPIGLVMILIIIAFLRDARRYLRETEEE